MLLPPLKRPMNPDTIEAIPPMSFSPPPSALETPLFAVCFSRLVHWLPVPEDAVAELDGPPNRRLLDVILPVREERLTSRNRPGLKDPADGVPSSCPSEPAPGAFDFALVSCFSPGN